MLYRVSFNTYGASYTRCFTDKQDAEKFYNSIKDSGYNGSVNIACLSGLSYPIEYIKKLGQSATAEQKQRMDKRKTIM